MNKLRSIVAACIFVLSGIAGSIPLGTGPVLAFEPQTVPTITVLKISHRLRVGNQAVLYVEWRGDDSEHLERTGFCVQWQKNATEWVQECFNTLDRHAKFTPWGQSYQVKAKVRVSYADGLYSPWSAVAIST